MCSNCQVQDWIQDKLDYEPKRLMDNRDMIKQIICIGCTKASNVKKFLDHCGKCRIERGIPSILKQEESLKLKNFSDRKICKELNTNSEIEATQASKIICSPTQANTSNISPLARPKLFTARSPNSKSTCSIKYKNNTWKYNSHMKTIDSEM